MRTSFVRDTTCVHAHHCRTYWHLFLLNHHSYPSDATEATRQRLSMRACAAQDAQAMFDSSMTAAAIAKRVQELQEVAGIKAQLVNPAGRGAGIITLTGWVALAALASLVVVIVGGTALAYRRWAGLDKPLTIVTKSGDV